MSLKTFKNGRGSDVLDLTEYEFTDQEQLLRAVDDNCRRYSKFAPDLIPDRLLLTSEQRALLPEGNFLTTPFNIMEIEVIK